MIQFAYDKLKHKQNFVEETSVSFSDERSDSPTPVYGGRRVHEENIGTEGGEATDGIYV